MTARDEALRALVNTIIRDCCESETSDPERGDTIMIREGTLREILERVLLTTRQEVEPVAWMREGATTVMHNVRFDKPGSGPWIPLYTSTGQTSDAGGGDGIQHFMQSHRQDARRYRFIRECDAEEDRSLHVTGAFGSELKTGKELDAAVDAAMESNHG